MIPEALRSKQLAAMDKLERISWANNLESPNCDASVGALLWSARSASLVPITDDYTNDDRLCLTCVAFPDAQLVAQINTDLIPPLSQRLPGHYYYPPESLHLTLQNVQTINSPPTFDDGTIKRVTAGLGEVFKQCGPLQFELFGLLRLPTSLSISAFCDEHTERTINSLRTALVNCGLPDNKTYIDPDVIFGNITICRFRSAVDNSIFQITESMDPFLANFTVKEACLISTNAVCHPAKTTVLHRFRL